MSSFHWNALLNSRLEPDLLHVEVASTLQIPSFYIVGLPGPEVAEARERVRAAFVSSGFEFPRRRVVINLSPAHLPKYGTGLDLAMALAILTHSQNLKLKQSEKWAAWGELGLDGSVKSAGQTTRLIHAAWIGNIENVVIPQTDLIAARKSLGLIIQSQIFRGAPPKIYGVSCFKEARALLLENRKRKFLEPDHSESTLKSDPVTALSLPPLLERTIGVAAAGEHHLLLLGPRGVGKTRALESIARAMPELPAPVKLERALTAELKSGERNHQEMTWRRVGAHVRPAALIGSMGSRGFRPGEFTLAHGGLLLADELPEWANDSRESLREPLESGQITLNRTRASWTLPARFTLAASGNYCPCGGWPPEIALPSPPPKVMPSPCHCPPKVRMTYLRRLSGPILDRIDLIVRFNRFDPEGGSCRNESPLKERVQGARNRLLTRWGAPPGQLTAETLEELLREYPKFLMFPGILEAKSLRGRHKSLRLALSFAAWDGLNLPELAHFAEAATYRPERLGLLA